MGWRPAADYYRYSTWMRTSIAQPDPAPIKKNWLMLVLLKPVIRVNATSAGEATRPFLGTNTTDCWYSTVPET